MAVRDLICRLKLHLHFRFGAKVFMPGFHTPGKVRNVTLVFIPLGGSPGSICKTTCPRQLNVQSFHIFFSSFSFPAMSLSQGCLSGDLTSDFHTHVSS